MSIERIPESEARRAGASGGTRFSIGPLTAVLIGISIAVAIFSQLGANESVLDKLSISRGFGEDGPRGLPEVLGGEFWRLLTPIFLHFSIVHILFNLLWLKDLGTMIEKRVGTLVLFGLVLVAGVVSNLGQFVAAGPFFGGMSGVVYALLGFVWMKSRFDPRSGLHLEKETVIMMIGWFFLCMTPLIPHVANYAHGFGLGVGMMWGVVSAKMNRSRAFTPSFEG